MSYKVVYGDILEQDVDAIVVPQVPHEGILSELTARIYNAAGYQNMMVAYQSAKYEAEQKISKELSRFDIVSGIEIDSHPIVAVTPGFDLKAKHAIHICVRAENWWDGQFESERKEKEFILYQCYHAVLECAHKTLCAKSIALPLLGTSLLGFPEEFSRIAAESSASGWLKEYLPPLPQNCTQNDKAFIDRWHGRDDPMKIHIVIPRCVKPEAPKALKPAANVPKHNSAPENNNVPEYDDAYIETFLEYEKTFENSIERSGKSRKEYCRIKCAEYLRRIDNPSKLSRSLGFQPSVITRFSNAVSGQGSGNIPKKKRVIALAIGMALSDYERFEFIRCSGNDYPFEKLDDQVETVIRSGIKSFKLINKKLCEIDPDYDLSAPLKKETSAPKREKIR